MDLYDQMIINEDRSDREAEQESDYRSNKEREPSSAELVQQLITILG
ncbi:17149_t:CDS:2 [Racocetra fulgida]|uniref:17149_t:CDS:1 n=1 Tax=Racocetra fulgida TaxID=60492 RepID=A0A9N8ZB82_9GLOM|nr:17149_t:CDS:2 [Racocetra fulgida]